MPLYRHYFLSCFFMFRFSLYTILTNITRMLGTSFSLLFSLCHGNIVVLTSEKVERSYLPFPVNNWLHSLSLFTCKSLLFWIVKISKSLWIVLLWEGLKSKISKIILRQQKGCLSSKDYFPFSFTLETSSVQINFRKSNF